MNSYDAHFSLTTLVSCYASDEDNVVWAIDEFFDEKLYEKMQHIMKSQIDYEETHMEIIGKPELTQFGLGLVWTGFISVDGVNKAFAQKRAEDFLGTTISPLAQLLNLEFSKQKDILFNGITNFVITEMVPF